jgi:hypothetical protein
VDDEKPTSPTIEYASSPPEPRDSKLAIASCLLAVLGNPWLLLLAVEPIVIKWFGHRLISRYEFRVIAGAAFVAFVMAIVSLMRVRRVKWLRGEAYAYIGLAISGLSLAMLALGVWYSYSMRNF